MLQVAAKKRDRMKGSLRKGSQERSRSSRSSFEPMDGPRQKYRFHHATREMNQLRSKDEMTVADMHNLVYEGRK